jgi:hypothetical protein
MIKPASGTKRTPKREILVKFVAPTISTFLAPCVIDVEQI